MQQIILQYYSWLSGLSGFFSTILGDLAYSTNIPLFSALIFGIIGAAAPCQISSSVVTLAFLSKEAVSPGRVWGKALAFLLGKVTVYTLIGGSIVLLGVEMQSIREGAIPAVVVARRLIGPLLILAGLFMVGLLKSRWTPGAGLSSWIEARVRGRQGFIPAYLLGAAFSFTFCPTLFWLFFGLTIPLALASNGSLIVPGAFALGTALPVLALAGLLASGAVDFRRFLRRFRSAEMWLQRIAGIIFILIGIQETFLYWFL